VLAGKSGVRSDKTSHGLETEFNNEKETEQTYTFQFEKVRTASVEVSGSFCS
jgi:hypothetical protein